MSPRPALALGIALALLVSVAPAQTVPTDRPPPPAAAPSRVPESDDDAWSSLNASAQCKDGTYYHGKPDVRTCREHGGVGRWLRDREQPLIR